MINVYLNTFRWYYTDWNLTTRQHLYSYWDR